MNIEEQFKIYRKNQRHYRTKEERILELRREMKKLLRDIKHRKEQFWNDPRFWDIIIVKGHDYLVHEDLYINNTYRRLDKRAVKLQKIYKSI